MTRGAAKGLNTKRANIFAAFRASDRGNEAYREAIQSLIMTGLLRTQSANLLIALKA